MIGRLTMSQGIFTSIHRSDYENIYIIKLILKCFQVGIEMEQSNLSQDDWVKVDSLPMNFADFRYRVVLKGLSGQEWIDKYSRILGA